MSSKLRVAIGGASGQTGLNIVAALLAESAKFEIIALVRPESIDKEVFVDLEQRGVAIRAVAFTDLPAVVATLEGVDVVISCLTVEQKEAEIGLIHAAKQAEVGRYVPSFFATVCPPRGVQSVRDAKEDLLDHIRRLYLPYTVIDVGWWYQLSVPLVPSGKLDDLISAPAISLAGQGDMQNAFTDHRDIGKYVARIIADERTINKHVFVYNEVSTQEAIWSKVEKLMDEAIPRKYSSKEEMERTIAESRQSIASNAASGRYDPAPFLALVSTEYVYSWGIRGDNTPDRARYLGYLIGSDLYPDLKGTSLCEFLSDLVERRIDARLYVGRPGHPLNAK